MATISDKLLKISDIKNNIKNAIKSKGVEISDTLKFEEYPNKILSIKNNETNGIDSETGRKILFYDDFDTFNTDNWLCDVRGDIGNNEIQYYRAENVSVENSNLVITAKKENYLGKTWTSGQIISRGLKEFQYGRFEARIKMPSAKGIWPAFWTLGRGYYGKDVTYNPPIPWAKCGEIDIIEYFNANNYYIAQPIWDLGNGVVHGTSSRYEGIDFTQYHVYAMEWTRDYIQFFCDGVAIGDKYDITNLIHQDGNNYFQYPHYMLLCIQVGGTYGDVIDGVTPNENKMYVDWVRILEEKNDIEEIKTSAENVSINVGGTTVVTANVYPSNVEDKTIKWSSSNNDIATVIGGRITGVSVGSCNAIIESNGIRKEINVTVN